MQPLSNNSSFIPKKTIKKVERSRGRKRVYILSYVSYGLFFGTVAASVFIFAYTYTLSNQLQAKIDELDSQRETYNQSDLVAIKEWQRQLRIAEAFYSKHISPYQVLSLLERSTAADIQFRSFNYTQEENGLSITMRGETDNLDGVAFQDGTFRDHPLFGTVQIANVNKTSDAATNALNNVNVQSSNTDIDKPKPTQFSVEFTIANPEALVPFDISVYNLSESTSDTAAVPGTFDSVNDTNSDETFLPTFDDGTEEVI